MNVTAKMDQAGANDRDRALRERAQRVIPGGMCGHMNAARLPPEYPQYFVKAEGARIWDVNGRDYVDFMCAWGPMVLGYRDPDVEAAVRTQGALGDSLNGPSERLVELAERLAGTIPHCDWSLLAKNGTYRKLCNDQTHQPHSAAAQADDDSDDDEDDEDDLDEDDEDDEEE